MHSGLPSHYPPSLSRRVKMPFYSPRAASRRRFGPCGHTCGTDNVSTETALRSSQQMVSSVQLHVGHGVRVGEASLRSSLRRRESTIAASHIPSIPLQSPSYKNEGIQSISRWRHKWWTGQQQGKPQRIASLPGRGHHAPSPRARRSPGTHHPSGTRHDTIV